MALDERDAPRSEPALRRLAEVQFGLLSRAQALEAGLKPAAIGRRMQSGQWERVLPGVYRIVGVPVSGRQAALAAALWAGPGSLVSHATAAVLHGIDGTHTTRIEIWVPSPRDPRSPLVTVHRGQRLDRADRMMLGPIPVTTPIRTLVDLAGRLPDDRLLAAMESVFRKGLGTPERLAVRLDALEASGRPGAGRLARLLAERGIGVLESRLEAKVWLVLDRAGLPRPVRQHDVVIGGRRYRLDFAWPEHRVALECDGWSHHSGREAFVRDRARLSDIGAAGWRVVAVTWEHATREPERVVAWVRAALRRAAA